MKKKTANFRNKQKKVIRVLKYNIEYTIYDDNTTELTRVCDGFTALELLGVLDLTSRDIKEQIGGEHRPDIIKRTVIVD